MFTEKLRNNVREERAVRLHIITPEHTGAFGCRVNNVLQEITFSLKRS